jgi:hypothetical protein
VSSYTLLLVVLPNGVYIRPKKVEVRATSLAEDLSKVEDLGKE